ncbi:MAG: rRNA cytosine-C5-methyltransferase [Candidatus Cryptobacteroides sp.]
MELNPRFREMMEEAIGQERARVAFSAFDSPASCSVRLNPLKYNASACLPEGEKVEWSPFGRILAGRPKFTLDPAFHSGCYYVQDSSSMFVGHLFREVLKTVASDGRMLKVLDLCAAPGGKTTDLAASLRAAVGENFILVSNEVMKQRAGVLADNVALWGDPNVVVTNDDPKAFSGMKGWFDLIVADVPCSGEGMFRKDEEAVAQWSEDNVELCRTRQRRIIADVWDALAPGGIMIYSTCTFNRRENDGNVQWIAENLGAELISNDLDGSGVIRTEFGYSLVPGFVPGEGQYCASLRKTSGLDWKSSASFRQSKYKALDDKALAVKINDLFTLPVVLKLKGETVVAVPENISAEVTFAEAFLHVIAAGTAVGTIKGKDLVPDADLALSVILRDGAFPSVEVDRETALKFLHRDAIVLPVAERGYVLLKYGSRGLGFVKNLGNRCNNLHPMSRRIRMDI